MNKENKLGMGLGALLQTSTKNSNTNEGVKKINISEIIPNPNQPDQPSAIIAHAAIIVSLDVTKKERPA